MEIIEWSLHCLGCLRMFNKKVISYSKASKHNTLFCVGKNKFGSQKSVLFRNFFFLESLVHLLSALLEKINIKNFKRVIKEHGPGRNSEYFFQYPLEKYRDVE